MAEYDSPAPDRHEHQDWGEQETGAGTGSLRENDPASPGFTAHDPLFRSHFQHANALADRAYADVRPAYQLGFGAAVDPRYAGQPFEQVERDLEHGWLNVRTRGGDWQAVRDYAREGYERGRRLGVVETAAALPPGTTRSHERATFADPVPEGIDPTAPDSPEQTLAFQHEDNRGPEWRPREVGETGLYAEADIVDADEGTLGRRPAQDGKTL